MVSSFSGGTRVVRVLGSGFSLVAGVGETIFRRVETIVEGFISVGTVCD